MEKNKKFRNHISVILQKVIRTAGVAAFVFATRYISEVGEIPNVKDALILLGVVFACFVISFLVHYILWAKTCFYIQDEALVLERNTLNKKKNTIGIKNISNINLEQTLFQMAIGTCTLKLDTNTLTTADKTDVSIVLKKKDAEQFRMYLLGQQEFVEEVRKEEVSTKAFTEPAKEIFMHGLLSWNLLSLLVAGGAVASIWGIFLDMGEINQTNKMDSIASIAMLAIVGGSMVWKVVKEFLRYLEFSIERKDDKVYLQYGIIKRVTYSIPVEKINAVRLNQTMIARLAKRYMVEVINVGMGNDEEEKHSFFLPYGKKEKIEERLNVLLPEFEITLGSCQERQPKGVGAVWFANGLLGVGIGVLAAAIAAEFMDAGISMVIAVAVVTTLYIVLLRRLNYITASISVGDNLLQIAQGSFSKYILFVKYDKIQFLTMKQCMVAKRYGIQKGQIHLLAAAINQVHNLPYMKEEKMEELREHIK